MMLTRRTQGFVPARTDCIPEFAVTSSSNE
jgi:hypothetical protein